MRKTLATLTSATVATALIVTSSTAIAQSAPAAAPQAQSSWMALSMLSPVGAGALGGAAAVAQPLPPPPPPAYDGRLVPPPLPVIAVWLAVLLTMVYIATRDDNDVDIPVVPNSPG